MKSTRRLVPSIWLALSAALLAWAYLRFSLESLLTAVIVFFVILTASYIILRARGKTSQSSSSAATKPAPPTEFQSENINRGTETAREPDVQVDQFQDEVVSGAELVGFETEEVNEGTVQVRQQVKINRGAIVGARIDRLGKDNSTEKNKQN